MFMYYMSTLEVFDWYPLNKSYDNFDQRTHRRTPHTLCLYVVKALKGECLVKLSRDTFLHSREFIVKRYKRCQSSSFPYDLYPRAKAAEYSNDIFILVPFQAKVQFPATMRPGDAIKKTPREWYTNPERNT